MKNEEIEAPYELPEGWKWESLANTCDMYQPKTISTKELIENGKYLVYGANGIIGRYDKYNHEKSQLLVTCRGATCGAVNISEPYSWINGNAMVINPKNEKLDLKYLSYIFQSEVNFGKLITGSAQPQITRQSLLPVLFPLPPLSEQQRIVNRIESMFAKLDEAKEKAQNVLDSFETRKAAILHKAFTGELTAKWRRENDVGDDSWEEKTLGELLFPMTSKNPTGDTFRYIDIDAIDNENQVVRCPKTIVTSEAPSRASRELKENDVLFSMVRPYLKNIAFIDNSLSDCIASTGFYICRCKEVIFPFYLYNFLCSKDAIDYLMQFMKGDNSPSIRKDDLLGMKINLPTLPEQQEIVRILDSVLEKERTAKQAAEAVLEQIDLLKKTILARAFRGEL